MNVLLYADDFIDCMSMNQLCLKFMIVVLEIYEISAYLQHSVYNSYNLTHHAMKSRTLSLISLCNMSRDLLEICYNFEIFFQHDHFCSQTWWIQLLQLAASAEHLSLLDCTLMWSLQMITHVITLHSICVLCLIIWIINSSTISSLTLFLLQIKLNFNDLWKTARIFYNC